MKIDISTADIITCKVLTTHERVVLLGLLQHTNEAGESYTSIKELANYIGISFRSEQRNLQTLTNKGVITKTHRINSDMGIATNRYKINSDFFKKVTIQ